MSKKNSEKYHDRFDYWLSRLQPDVMPVKSDTPPGDEEWANVATDCVGGTATTAVQDDVPGSLIEEIALHEALHSLLTPLTQLMEVYYSEDYTLQKEHAIINRLVRVILRK